MVKALRLEDLELSVLAKLLALDVARLNKTAVNPGHSVDVRFSAAYYANVLETALAKITALDEVGKSMEVTKAPEPPDEYLDTNGVPT